MKPEPVPRTASTADTNHRIEERTTKGWASGGDWLVTDYRSNLPRQYRPFEAARTFAQSLGLNNLRDWRDYYKSDATTGSAESPATLPHPFDLSLTKVGHF